MFLLKSFGKIYEFLGAVSLPAQRFFADPTPIFLYSS